VIVKFLQAAVVYFSGEVAGLIIFPVLEKRLNPKNNSKFNIEAILKGILERLILFFALLHGFPQILIAFAAMKLGTRLHHEKESDISNTYFLVGNLMSIFIALLAVVITKAWWAHYP
jgi:hypothetical protein